MRILLVEDQLQLANSIAQYLQQHGLVIDLLHDGRSADMLLRDQHYELLILDISLPYLDGFQVLSNLRQHNQQTPVLMLSAHSETADRVLGLNLGADDYLAKPFDFTELLARVKALLRRSLNINNANFVCGNLSYDVTQQSFAVNQQRLTLTSTQQTLLLALITRAGRILSKDQLASTLFGLDSEVAPEAVEVHIHRLRKKLQDSSCHIVTFRGIGYMLEQQHEN